MILWIQIWILRNLHPHKIYFLFFYMVYLILEYILTFFKSWHESWHENQCFLIVQACTWQRGGEIEAVPAGAGRCQVHARHTHGHDGTEREGKYCILKVMMSQKGKAGTADSGSWWDRGKLGSADSWRWWDREGRGVHVLTAMSERKEWLDGQFRLKIFLNLQFLFWINWLPFFFISLHCLYLWR